MASTEELRKGSGKCDYEALQLKSAAVTQR